MATANQAKPTSDKNKQQTMGDIVPEQDQELEEITSRWISAKAGIQKAQEKFKAVKAEAREYMIENEIRVYHSRTSSFKLKIDEELTIRLVKDTPDGDEG